MKTKHLRHIIILGTVVMTALLVVQVYWFRKAFEVSDKQFDHGVQMALMRVADSVAASSEVRKLSSNFYFVVTESPLDNQALDSALQRELLSRSLNIDYELGVYNADDDTLVYGKYVEATQKHLVDQGSVSSDARGVDKNFAVYFPGKQSFVVAQLDIWIFSTLALLLMTGFFAYAIIQLLRERKFSELKNDFVNNMTHEFKTPVTNICITGEIIRGKIAKGENVEVYLDILSKENEKLRRKIDQVLSGAALEHIERPSLQPLDIHQLIATCAETFEIKLKERRGRMSLAFDAKNSIVTGDRELLTQVINNLIDNAEKYSPHQPQITVRTQDLGDRIEIGVADKGIGIPREIRSKVFDKFFRGQRGNVHNVKGFGLGLSFVKRVVESHRGEIDLLSEVNEGTEVRIVLPKICA